MLGQVSWARLSPSGPAVLLLALCAVLTTQDICSSPGLKERGGNHQTPVLYLNASSAQEGETVLVQCTIDEQFPATRVFFCKNGQEEFSLKAQHGNINYSLVLTITSRSAGTYTCGYQKKNEKNWVKNSALSAPRTLSVPGSSAGETTQDIHSSPGMVLAVAAVGLVLLAAGSWFVIKKGACRGRCPRLHHRPRSTEQASSHAADERHHNVCHGDLHPDPIALKQGKGTGALPTAAFALLQRACAAITWGSGLHFRLFFFFFFFFFVTGKGCQCLAKMM
ncbi:uncharacterized protein [Anas acuta]|uniref:uncharacterized protein isoform X4 n=1 Tax=Anas acuta TaxID=28680 RepID=UPI0035C90D7D